MWMASWAAAPRRRKASPRRATTPGRGRSRFRLERLEGRIAPATLIVQTVADGTGEVEACDGVYKAATLRAAVDFANASPGADTIKFARAIAGQTASLTMNDAKSPTAFGGATALVITDSLTIQGDAKKGITLDAFGARRLLAVAPDVTLNLQNLTLTGGAALGGDGGGGGNGGGGGAGLGGAIYVLNATVNLVGCTLTANVAQGGQGGDASSIGANGGGGGGGGSAAFDGGNGSADSGGGGGGGMYGAGAAADGSTGGLGGAGQGGQRASANGTGVDGGGGGGGTSTFFVGHSGGPATGLNAANFGGGGGGAAGGGRLFGDDHGGQGGFGAGGGGGSAQGGGGVGGFGGGGGGSTGHGRAGSAFGGGSGGDSTKGVGGGGGGAGMGGAVFLYGGKIALTNCTLAGNAAVGGAGGSGNSPGGRGQGIGGAICALAGGVTTTNCTIYNNTGDRGQIVVLTNAAARPASVDLANTVVAGSAAPAGPDVLAVGLRGARPARVGGVGNFFGRPGRFPRRSVAGAGDPRLGPLADNGGPTRTLLPMPGSPLIDAGRLKPRGGLASTDQRDQPRVVGASVDIGAVEVS